MSSIPARVIKWIKRGINVGSRGNIIKSDYNPGHDSTIRILETHDRTYIHVMLNAKIRITLFNKLVAWGKDCEIQSWRKSNKSCNKECITGAGKARQICMNVRDPSHALSQVLKLRGNESVTIKEYKKIITICSDNFENIDGIINNTRNYTNINQLCKYTDSPRQCIPRCQTGYTKGEHISVAFSAD